MPNRSGSTAPGLADLGRRLRAWWTAGAGPSPFARHVWLALFAAAWAVALRIELADYALEHFRGRTMSWPVLEGLSVGARTSLYSQAVLLAGATFAAALVAARALERWIEAEDWSVVHGLALAGCALFACHACLVPVWTAVNLITGLLACALAMALADRWLFRGRPAGPRATTLAALALGAFWLPIVLDDHDPGRGTAGTRYMDWAIGALAFGAYLVLRALLLLARAERRPACWAGLTVFLAGGALAPWVSVGSIELYLTLNHRGVHALEPFELERLVLAGAALVLLLAAWRVARRADPWSSWPRRLEVWVVPLWIVGLFTQLHYLPWVEFNEDLFEPANSGLMIQQWVDFGRLPFIETFNAHGFSDAATGFLWRLVHGSADETWVHWSGLTDGLILALLYGVLRRVTGQAWLALFVCVVFPFLPELAPYYARVGVFTLALYLWVRERPTTWRCALLAAGCVGLFLWRLDNGLAGTVAVALLFLGERALDPATSLRVGRLVAGSAAVAGLALVLWWALCLASGVDPWLRLVDLRHLVDSNEAFGAPTLSDVLLPKHAMHLVLVPLAVAGLTLVVLRRERERARAGAAFDPAVGAVLFLAAYTFVNFPRGLVRHTFREVGNSYLQSFALLALALGVFVLVRRGGLARAAAFLGTALALGATLNLQPPPPARARALTPLYLRLEQKLIEYPRVAHSEEYIDRSPMWPRLVDDFYGDVAALVERHLAGPDETFLDLAHCPMLYVYTHRRSPHYLNHLFLSSDEWLHQRQIEDFERHEIPFVITRTERDLMERDGAVNMIDPDMVDARTRDYRYYEWVYRRYEPWCIVQRWQVWKRRDWASPAAPTAPVGQQLATLAADADFVRQAAGARRVERALELPAGRATWLSVRGLARAAGTLTLRLTVTQRGAGLLEPGQRFEREIRVTAGSRERHFLLPGELRGAEVAELTLDCGAAPGLEQAELTLTSCEDPDVLQAFERATRFEHADLRRIPWYWGNFDEAGAARGPVLRDLAATNPQLAAPNETVGIEPRENAVFTRGISTGPAAYVQAAGDEARLPRIGDRVRLAGSGVRSVIDVRGRRVFVDGGVLDPARDGAPERVEILRSTEDEQVLPIGSWQRYTFEPLPDPLAPCYLALTLERQGAGRSYAWVRWGVGAQDTGSLGFTLPAEGRQTYLLRVSAYYTWAGRAVDWVSLCPQGAPVRVVSARLLAGD